MTARETSRRGPMRAGCDAVRLSDWPSLHLLPPVVRQSVFGITQDFENGLAIVSAQVNKSTAVMRIREDVIHHLIHTVPRHLRQLLESFRIDEIAARILEEPMLQIKFP